jgi:hypothetical protein
VLVAQTSPSRAEHLWAAVPPEGAHDSLHALLARARETLSQRRVLTLDYPAYEGAEAIQRAGFVPYRTLIWMRAD